MIRSINTEKHGNLWNRLARNLIYDSKQLLLYCGIKVPERKEDGHLVNYTDFVDRVTRRTNYGAIYDSSTRRIHFEPGYIQEIVDQASRFDFPVYDRSFGPGGIAGFIQEIRNGEEILSQPNLNHILHQAMISKRESMPFSYVSARQMGMLEVEQFGVMTNVFDGPIFLSVMTSQGVDEAEASIAAGNYIITVHTLFESPLTLSFRRATDIFTDCVSKQIPVMLVTQPFSGHNAPMTPYGTALIAFSEFLAGMVFASTINPETRVINGALPTLCTPGKIVKLKIGSIVHNFTNYLIAYTSKLLDIPSIQSGCTMEGNRHEKTILDTDYETVRAMILWLNIFENWHMLRHCYGFLNDMRSFSFEKAIDDIAVLRHIQSLDDNGIFAVLSNNVKLYNDLKKANELYEEPTRVFNREKEDLLNVIIETIEYFNGDFGRHEHTLKNIPEEWF
jgi:hypothetical protein